MPKIPPAALRALANEIATLDSAARAALKRQFARQYDISPSTLSRQLHRVGCRSHERADRGRRRLPITDEQLNVIAALQASSQSLRKGNYMPASDAIEIAEQNRMAPAISPSSFNAWLRSQNGSRRDQSSPTPHVELRSLGPNHVHQADFSLAVNWKVENNKPIYEHLVYKNKLPLQGVPRIWRLIVVDHATGCFFPHYTVAPGENELSFLEGLYFAWTEKTLHGESIKSQYPFRGVPRILMVDRGSAVRANATAALLNRLDCRLHVCREARSKGTVEVAHNWWEAHFETRLRLQPPQSIEQLNEWAMQCAAHYCATKRHSRHGSERSTLWAWHINRSEETKLREIACGFEVFKSVAQTDPVRCKVGGSRFIRFKSNHYRVPECLLPGTWVEVQYSPFSFPQVQVRSENEPLSPAWLCAPAEVTKNEYGFDPEARIIGEPIESTGRTHTPANKFAAAAKSAAKDLVGKVQAFGYHLARTPEIGVPVEGEEIAIDKPTTVMTRVVPARCS